MKFDARQMAGSASTSGRCIDGCRRLAKGAGSKRSALLSSAILLVLCATAQGQALYKYKGVAGEWVYTDRAPDNEVAAEVRELATGIRKSEVLVNHRLADRQIQFFATNEFYAPVELVLELDSIENVALPMPDDSLHWLLSPRSRTELLQLDLLDAVGAPHIDYRFAYLYGDPKATHTPDQPYRAPFAKARKFLVSQAFPVGVTHNTPDSYYAVDIAMPVGTDIYAARGGTVVEVASTNFRSGPNPEEEGAAANLVRIMHDDGTFAIYAHLNWNTIRVQPGDRVERGEYIADSGNTGFSTGPHLHFAVLHNKGLRMESLPVVFEGPNHSEITPEYGKMLTAY